MKIWDDKVIGEIVAVKAERRKLLREGRKRQKRELDKDRK